MNLPQIDWPITALLLGLAVIALSFWHAQRKKVGFDFFDLVIENGKVSKTSVAFMLVLFVTSWMMLVFTYKGTMTEGYFGLYLGAWVAPLVARVVFNKDAPQTSYTSTTETTKTVEVKEPQS